MRSDSMDVVPEGGVTFTTADLCDRHEVGVRVVTPGFRDFGGLRCFSGPIATVKVHEDNTVVRASVEKPGEGRVLVVEEGGWRGRHPGDLLRRDLCARGSPYADPDGIVVASERLL